MNQEITTVSSIANRQDAERENWDLIIRPKSRFLYLNLKELMHYRDLVGLLVRRDIASTYKQTILGWLWFIVQPLMMTLIYSFVFGGIAKIKTDDIPQPLFYFCGTVLWGFFSTNLTKCSETFNANSGLFSKI